MNYLTPQQYFRLQGTRPRKRFGQHFLSQLKTAELIVRNADLESSDVVVEVGPGLGALTQFILPKVRCLHLVELDRDLAQYLVKATPPSPCIFEVHQQDVLTFDFQSLAQTEGQGLVILGNLPYNISSPLVFHLLDSLSVIKRAVFMVQKEVGERLAAKPGTKDYGVLSVLLGVCARVTPLFTVGPGQFYPPPQVDSLVLRIDFFRDSFEEPPSFKFLRNMVNAAFQQRRKTLQNSLKSLFGGDRELLERAFEEMGIDPRRRPETLSPEEFLHLARIMQAGLQKKGGRAG
ncbi:16S rRNA (adenine(1518)-N(6)/adenine(1519)-N(6))-dimethyltransferase RsmA [Desulforhabdus amnigena]|uniref:Ribosomal RNA small subunit methyltransferase A n=1 Tax=Desulforhabdus amnigena TaxID=40218 RepID=A0A9W6FX06_9BACT|nr:16S rRNA (adenine(1518)-N(6)/adenine(1519)-N(6))-dimethyltransferase RsmA [Desulforhabdus amnigena]NLJ27112.1 ribosomal RNA small subunit methyltransferase A [Deltaproteobacteria bacterium]GLI36415.1 ribosomal RNA small subunit methyltransferase A [Desulforhabdus amnigena]